MPLQERAAVAGEMIKDAGDQALERDAQVLAVAAGGEGRVSPGAFIDDIALLEVVASESCFRYLCPPPSLYVPSSTTATQCAYWRFYRHSRPGRCPLCAFDDAIVAVVIISKCRRSSSVLSLVDWI